MHRQYRLDSITHLPQPQNQPLLAKQMRRAHCHQRGLLRQHFNQLGQPLLIALHQKLLIGEFLPESMVLLRQVFELLFGVGHIAPQRPGTMGAIVLHQ